MNNEQQRRVQRPYQALVTRQSGTSLVHDYNGAGDWSAAAIQGRYARLARELRVPNPLDLSPDIHVQGDRRWIYPVMDRVIVGIKAGDPACVEIGVQFVENPERQTFGLIFHSNTARALLRASLSESQIKRIRARMFDMLVGGELPREITDYCKLVRRIGLGPRWREVQERVDRSNPHVMRHVLYLERYATELPEHLFRTGTGGYWEGSFCRPLRGLG